MGGSTAARDTVKASSGRTPNPMRLDHPVFTYALAAWLGLALLAILNGAVREAILVAPLGTDVAHIVSTLLLAVVVVLVAAGYLAVVPGTPTDVELLAVGLLWTLLTVAFEFVVFGLLMGEPLARLLADYDVTSGRVWVLVPLTTLFGPIGVAAARRRYRG